MNFHDIVLELDNWVSQHGTGNYIPQKYSINCEKNFTIPENFGIQQVRKEILEFIQFLLKRTSEKRQTALEIGLGKYGSTHFLWRHLFKKTATIENQHERLLNFGTLTSKYYKKWILNDAKSAFFFGKSNDSVVVGKVHEYFKSKKLDLLFIDGDHTYSSILTDYLLYEPLVNPGGIIAFHDFLPSADNIGVSRFIKNLEAGGCFGRKRIQKIIHSNHVGIAYYVK